MMSRNQVHTHGRVTYLFGDTQQAKLFLSWWYISTCKGNLSGGTMMKMSYVYGFTNISNSVVAYQELTHQADPHSGMRFEHDIDKNIECIISLSPHWHAW